MRKVKADPGKYNKNQNEFAALIDELYRDYPGGVTLPPEYASFVHGNLLQFLIRLARYKFAARMLQKTDEVLEVGSGSGLGTMFLAQFAAHVTGLDVKTTEVAEARSIKTRDNAQFLEQDLFTYSPEKKFDVVVAMDVIEHMSVRLGHTLIRRMADLTNPDGLLIIGTPSIHSYPYQGKLSRASHVKCYDQDELKDLIGTYYQRLLAFSMNDEVVHTGNPKMAWYYIVVAFGPKQSQKSRGSGQK